MCHSRHRMLNLRLSQYFIFWTAFYMLRGPQTSASYVSSQPAARRSYGATLGPSLGRVTQVRLLLRNLALSQPCACSINGPETLSSCMPSQPAAGHSYDTKMGLHLHASDTVWSQALSDCDTQF